MKQQSEIKSNNTFKKKCMLIFVYKRKNTMGTKTTLTHHTLLVLVPRKKLWANTFADVNPKK